MIEVKNLTKFYGNFCAVDNISFNIEKGEIVGFLGPNGAGKTTTMRILTGYFPPTKGSVKIAGYDIIEYPYEAKKRIGYMPENVPLYNELRVATFLYFVAKVKQIPYTDMKKEVEKVIEECGLEDVRNVPIRRLSKGYRQRVGLAQALVGEPEILILDEPTIGLDPKQVVEVRQVIKNLSGRRTVILSTHILPEVQMICERVLVINKGKLVAMDTPENLSFSLGTRRKVYIEVEGKPELVKEKLLQIPNVINISVEPKDEKSNIYTYLIESARDVDLRREISKCVVENNFSLLELRSITLSLEEVFMQLVREEAETVQ
jgi:ABC-2 type transport system ATP-binding protein